MTALLAPQPLSVPQLTARWGCSEGLVRKLIRSGDLQCLRLGALIRIAAAEVERFECQQHQNTPSSGSEAGLLSSGGNHQAESASGSTRQIAKARRRKPAASGNALKVVTGPWAE